MDTNSLLATLVVGLIAGWLAGQFIQGHGLGIVGDIVVGIVGAFIGSLLFGHFGIVAGYGLLGSILVAFIGAAIFLFLVRLMRQGAK